MNSASSLGLKSCRLVLQEMLSSKNLSKEEIGAYIKLKKLCRNQTFQTNNKVYQQQYEIAMGNSLFPFIANLLMGWFEVGT